MILCRHELRDRERVMKGVVIVGVTKRLPSKRDKSMRDSNVTR